MRKNRLTGATRAGRPRASKVGKWGAFRGRLQGVAFDERRRPRKRAALPATAAEPLVPPLYSPRPRARRPSVPERGRPPARRVAGHAAQVDARGHRAAARGPLDARGRGAGADRRAAARARALAGRAARGRPQRAARLRLHGGPVPAARGDDDPRGRRARERARARADPPDLGLRRVLVPGAGGRHLRRRPPTAALHGRGGLGGLPPRGVPAARARVRAGAGPDRRRGGQALPPVRARAADPRRPRRSGHRRGDGGPRDRAAPARLADHGPRPPALAAALHRAGRRRPPRARGRRRVRPRPPPGRHRLRRPGGLHAADRGRGGGGGGRHRRALRRPPSSTRCPRARG